MLQEAVYYWRMGLGIHRYLRSRPLPDPEAAIRHQLEHREDIFLETVRRGIFSWPENPYREMFRLAGCTFDDLAASIRRDGLEKSLENLHRQGVYLSHDEFKGKTPIVRSGRHIPARSGAFRNPLVTSLWETRSSGSRSKGVRTPTSRENQLYREAHEVLRNRELGLDGRAHVELKPVLPSSSGLSPALRGHRLGTEVERWFATRGGFGDSAHYRLMTHALVRFGNLLGARAPLPTYLPPNDFTPVAEWIAQRRSQGVSCYVCAYPSPAVRVASAAQRSGLDIQGTLFIVAGEALTDAKRAVIEKAGAEANVRYPISEIGGVGCACRQMKTGNCVHLFRDCLAVISHRRPAPLCETEVNALLFTTLLPFAPHLLINADMQDSAVIEPARCDCLYTQLGFNLQLRDITSYGKLTGQGMTLVGSDMVRVLEEALPAALGGSPGDYQLVEHDAAGQTQITLRVSPRAGAVLPGKVKQCFLSEIRRYYGGTLAARTWKHAEAVDVVIGEPYTTSTGKVLSLHLLGSTGKKSHAT